MELGRAMSIADEVVKRLLEGMGDKTEVGGKEFVKLKEGKYSIRYWRS